MNDSTGGGKSGTRWAGIVTVLVFILSSAVSFSADAPPGPILPYGVIPPPVTMIPSWTVESDREYALFGWSSASAGDVNGDGFDDVIIGQVGNGGGASVYLGSAAGLSLAPAWTAPPPSAASRFGCSVASAGDVNGDGYGDVIVGADGYGSGQGGEASLYLGSASGLSPTPAWRVQAEQGWARFGESVASAGDVNGDGYGDVIVGAGGYNDGRIYSGGAFAYLGSASGLSPTPAWIGLSDQAGSNFGKSVASAGDVNGDGYDDVIVGAYDYSNGQSYEGRAFVYMGSASGLSATPAWTAESDQARALFGYSVAPAGDVNGDGYGDVIVGAHGGDRAFLYLGSAGGLSPIPDWTAASGLAYTSFGASVATAGDLNGDGFDDVIVGAPWYGNGSIFLYTGSASGLSPAPAAVAESDQHDSSNVGSFGSSLGSGDFNGDGFSDLVVGAAWYDNGEYNEGKIFEFNGFQLPAVVTVLNEDLDFDGYTTAQGDCDDGNPSIHPGAADTPDDGIDQDCNGADTVTCFVDADRDGYGSVAAILAADGTCDTARSEAAVAGDCDDENSSIHPGAADTPDDGVDQDCNGADTVTCFVDADQDGYGNKKGMTVLAADGSCDTAQSEAVCADDPKDADPRIHPGHAPDHCLRHGKGAK